MTPTLETTTIPEEEIQRALILIAELRNMQGTTGREKAIYLAEQMRAERERSQWQPIETAPWHKEVLVYSEEGGTGVLLAQFTSLRGLISDSEIDELVDQGMTEDEIDANAWFYCDFGGGARLEADCAPSKWMHLPNEEPRAEA